jgi:large subunit ribosomal protein L10
MMKQRTKDIPEVKKKAVEELTNLINTKKTILITSIKNIPGSQFQEIGKKLRGKALVKVPKKRTMLRALDNSKNKEAQKLKEHVIESTAILFSDLDAFDLAVELNKNTSPSKAKVGQEAPEDIEISEGPTDLVPGPAISELGALGIEIQIEKGKINIKKTKIIAEKGKKISQGAADLMSKLDIKPFVIGFVPLSAFDTKENKLYLEIKIDREGNLENLKNSFSKALAFAVEINYISKDTIKFLLAKASAHEKALENLQDKEPEVEEPKEVEKKGTTEEKVEEEKPQEETKTEDTQSEENK